MFARRGRLPIAVALAAAGFCNGACSSQASNALSDGLGAGARDSAVDEEPADAGMDATTEDDPGSNDAGAAEDASPELDAGEPDASQGDPDGAVPDGAVPDGAAPDSGDPTPIIVGCIPQEVSTRYDATWLFGNGCRADWDDENLVTFSETSIRFTGFEGTIAAADARTGALLAASDGIDIVDGEGVKTNEVSLGADSSSSQAVAFVGTPGSTGEFFVVTNSANASAGSGLYLSTLGCDTLAPAASPVTIAGTSNFTEALVTVRHSNGSDRWLLSAAPTGIAVLPVSAGGIGAPVITPWGSALGNLSPYQRAFLVFARDRTTFALTAEGVGAVLGKFDPATGAVSELRALPVPSTSLLYSAAFSADGSKLYLSQYAGLFWQIDLANNDAVAEVGPAGGMVRLAIDDKLYVANFGTTSLGVVANPNATAASLSVSTVTLPGTCTSSYGLPGLGDL
jgi:hypothetical protein